MGKTGDVVHESSASSVGEAGAPVAGLECRIGKAHIALPTDWIGRLVEYRPLPLPLARRWIGGIALHEDVPLISIALIPPQKPHARGVVTGVLLNVPSSPMGLALEIDEVFAFVRATVNPRRSAPGAKVPRWISSVITADQRQIGWIDVATMLADLAKTTEVA